MNFKMDLTKKQQTLVEKIDFPVEDREYRKEEIKQCTNNIANHIMSMSSKNGDLSNELLKYNELMNILVKNEK